MARRLYSLLGVAEDASDEVVRKAYRKLAKQLHPDLNPGDAKAEARFKEVAQAYHILGDADRRVRYDRGEIDEAGAERPHQHYYRAHADSGGPYHSTRGFEDFVDLGDIYADLFRHGARGGFQARGADIAYHLEVSFMDAVRGARTRVQTADGRSLDISVPAGIRDGQVLRLAGQGEPGHGGGPAGDALIEISVRPHRLFRREGDDILLELPITLDEAVLGAKVQVPTIHGPVTLTVPKGSSSGRVLRLRGKGLAAAGRSGDQLVTLRIVLPEQPDDELERFMAGWRERHRHDPRRQFGVGHG